MNAHRLLPAACDTAPIANHVAISTVHCMRSDRDCIVTNFQQRFAASREDLQRDTGSYCRRKFVAGTDVDSPTLPLPVQRASYAGDNYRRRWLRCLLGERVSRRPGEIPTAVLGHDADDTLHTRTHTHNEAWKDCPTSRPARCEGGPPAASDGCERRRGDGLDAENQYGRSAACRLRGSGCSS